MNTTTLASACGLNDTVLVVAATTGFVAGAQVRIDQEMFQVSNIYSVAGNGVNIPVLRALDGSVAQAHAAGANVSVGPASDPAWGTPAPQTDTSFPIAGRARVISSYSASGAIALPSPGNDAVAILNGTANLAMTVAQPPKDADGSLLFIASNGIQAATTVTFAGGLNGGGGGYDQLTLNALGPVLIMLMAVNGNWMIPNAAAMTGTVAALVAGVA